MPFDYTSGNPDNLVGGGPARMQDIQGPFYDLRAYLNSVVGPSGGQALPVLTAAPVLDVGVQGQRRAGRQLANADFTSLGLAAPIALWNLGDLTDVSGNGRVLVNKGAVPFGVGINGFSTTCAVFSGSTGQALYISDTGAADPFRIKTGSIGCWVRTAKRATTQYIVSKHRDGGGLYAWGLAVNNANAITFNCSTDGAGLSGPQGVTDVADDRWHFVVGTSDGATLRLYIDGVLDATASLGPLFGGAAPVNIGGYGGDGATAAAQPHYGRLDEVFVTADVLTDDQVRCLYATKVTHTLATTPSGARVNVHRRRKGGTLAAADFTTQPLRLHNFPAGASIFNDEGSNGVTLTNIVAGYLWSVAGADGKDGTGVAIGGGSHMAATDAGLPSGTAPRSYGCWFKTSLATSGGIIGWGTGGTGDARFGLSGNGIMYFNSGADSANGIFVADGAWHFAVAVEDNSAGDGVRRKLYVDGRLTTISTVLNSINLGGANRFRIGAYLDGTSPFTGQIDGAFVCGYAMAFDEIARLYAKGSQDLGVSPKNAGDHIERMSASDLLLIADTLESQHTIDVGVMA